MLVRQAGAAAGPTGQHAEKMMDVSLDRDEHGWRIVVPAMRLVLELTAGWWWTAIKLAP